MAGIEVYDLLRDEYDIQIEFGDLGNILAYLSIGDRPREIERLVSALAEVRRRFGGDGAGLMKQEYIDPQVAVSPQEAFYAAKESRPIGETAGCICSEFVMCYPPGIPILAPGERITKEILDYIAYAKDKGCSITGPEDPDILRLNVLKGERQPMELWFSEEQTPNVKLSIRVDRSCTARKASFSASTSSIPRSSGAFSPWTAT